jgi:phosphatidylserine decarboxylase
MLRKHDSRCLSPCPAHEAQVHPRPLTDLLGDAAEVERYRDGCYATLRLTASMYPRFHAPYDCRAEQVTYISGDTWNVNPIALKRVERLFCKNERVIVRTALKGSGQPITLVVVAAVLVASVRLHFVDVLLHLSYRGPNVIPCDARLAKGDEMGWFQHGSTIILFAPAGFELWEGVAEGQRIHMGEPLMRLLAAATSCPPPHR